LRFLCRARAKLLVGVFSGVEIFMQSSLQKHKLTVKVLAIFIQQVNHEKYIKQLLLGSRSICTVQPMQELVLNFLLNKLV
jgi:hypothetical protein